MNGTLEGKTVVLVGGSSGIGLAVAKQAFTQGARIVIASRTAAEHADSLSAAVGGKVETYSFDITMPAEYKGLFKLAGTIDHLVFTVRAQVKSAHFNDITVADAKLAFESKFWGPYGLIQAARASFAPSAGIILTSGISGEKIYPESSSYELLSAATETLCRALAVELAPLRVNVVSPGYVEPKSEETKKMAATFPLRRLGTADETALTYLYLMTNPYVTGTISVVDGGARLL
jgi:NAD(P)-dependent dehydrogenase (short-subunit alcohol dehydrogenase family)